MRYSTALERIEESFPQLNEDSDSYDADLAQDVVDLKATYERRGMTPTQALQKAVKKLVDVDTGDQKSATEVTPRVSYTPPSGYTGLSIALTGGYGSNRIKVVQHIYLGVASAKPMRANVTVDGKSYTYDARSMNELLKTQRIDLGRGLRGTHPLITLMNSAGSDFELESMRPTIVTIDRSI